MSKALVLAAMFMAHGAGWRGHERDTNPVAVEIVTELAQYASVALELVDAAKMVTFTDPEEVNMDVYEMFGDDFVDCYRDNDDVFPSANWCYDDLRDKVFEVFDQDLTDEQTAALNRALDAVIEPLKQ